MVAPKDALKDPLYSRHNLSYFYCGEPIQFPQGSLDLSPLLTLLFLSESVGFRGSETQTTRRKTEHPLQCNVVVSSDQRPPYFGTKTFSPAELRAWEHRENNSLFFTPGGDSE